jgi:hypothetical protein
MDLNLGDHELACDAAAGLQLLCADHCHPRHSNDSRCMSNN